MTPQSFQAGEPDSVQLSLLQAVTPQETRKAPELREYQKQMKRGIYDYIRQGTKRILVYGPTGSGKTLVLSSVIQDALNRGLRVLLLVHRDFLIDQTIETLLNLGIARDDIGVIKNGYSSHPSRPLQIAGIQSLRRREMVMGFFFVIADECHSVAFFQEYERVKAGNSDAIHLGFTASPWRLKSHTEYFGLHYDVIVKGPSIKALMDEGYLSSARYYGYGGVDISKLETNEKGDFKERQMERLFIASQAPQTVVEKLLELAEGRTGIVFNSGREQSILQTQLLNAAGISCEHVDAFTPIHERRRIYQRLEAGELRCISSIGCLTEGFNVKSISFIVFARATKSRALYVQIGGRGIRSCDGKQDCLILDFGGNVKRLGYLYEPQPITLDPKPKGEGKAMLKECPQCGSICHNFVRICLKCGYEFSADKEVSAGPEKFGELLDDQQLAMIRYIRSQRKARYTRNQHPDELWQCFKEKYVKELMLPNFRLKGAIFGGKSLRANYQRMVDYLECYIQEEWTQQTSRWMSHHLSIEFGLPVGDTVFCESCWELLGVDDVTPLAEIKEAYREALREIDPQDADSIDLLNWALDKALRLSRP